MVNALFHDLEHQQYVMVWYVPMKRIGHAVYEDPTRFVPR